MYLPYADINVPHFANSGDLNFAFVHWLSAFFQSEVVRPVNLNALLEQQIPVPIIIHGVVNPLQQKINSGSIIRLYILGCKCR